MADAIDDNRAARDAVLASVRRALAPAPSRRPLAPAASRNGARDEALAYIAAHRHGPRPAMPADLIERFAARAAAMASTVERIGSLGEAPRAVARYVAALALPGAADAQRVRTGACWPAFAALDWRGAGLAVEPRPAGGSDTLGITGCFCAVAETGTLVFVSGASTPTTSIMLPDTHVCIVRTDQVVSGMEEAFARLRDAHPAMPRAVHFVSGPSRTGDIEQTIVLGAHGPFRVHVLLLG